MTYESLKAKLVAMACDAAHDRRDDILSQIPWFARGLAGKVYDHELLSVPRMVDRAMNQVAGDFLTMTGADLVGLLQDVKTKSEYNC